MRRPVVALATLVVVGVQHAQGQHFVHFETGSPSSPVTTQQLQADMAEKTVGDQVALQTGTCATLWNKEFSTQCPPGSFMLLQKGYGAKFGVPDVFACQAAGCLHAPGPGEDDTFYLRNEGSIMEEAVAREVALLLETQPRTTSFRRHLAAMSKSFAKEGSDCQKTLSTLLSKASAGHGTATTIKFFAELARHRGFTGDVIDKTWAHLDEHHTQEMALDFVRRAPQLLVTQVARTLAKVGMEANAKNKMISRQKETLMEVRKKLSAALETGRDMKLEASRLRSQLSAAHESERKMEEDATELFLKMAEAHDRERDAAEKEASGLSSELTDLRKKLALEMDAREKSEKAVEVAKKEMTELRAALSSAHEEEVDGLTVELAGVEKLLAEERDATAAAKSAVEVAYSTIETVRSEARVAIQEADTENAKLREEAAAATSKLADAREQLLAQERDALAAATEAANASNADIEAVRAEAQDAKKKAEKEEALGATCSSSLVDHKRDAADKLADLASELEESRQLLTDALEAKDEMARAAEKATQELDEMEAEFKAGLEIATEMHESMRLMSDNFDGIEAGLRAELAAERTDERAQQGWRRERVKTLYDLDDCLDRAEACTENAEALVEVVEGAKDRLLLLFDEGERWREKAEECSDSLGEVTATHAEEMESCGKERLEHEQLLASLSGSNDQCDCPEIEVPTIEAGGNDSTPDVPTPSEPG